jgi:purine-cytosine permease-like protein
MTAIDPGPSPTAAPPAPAGVEANGLNVVAEAERTGRSRSLFWPWFGANVSVLGLGYGAFILVFGISFWQALVVGVLGIVLSFTLCGLVAVAGKRGSAPTMALSRAAFGVLGNRVPAVISWVLTVGWETVLASLAVLATSTVLGELGVPNGTPTKVITLVVVAALIIAAGVFGFHVVMRLQRVITIVTGMLTIVYILLTLPSIDVGTVAALPSGSTPAVIGAFVFMLTGFGLGWVNAAADYSRYLPRSTRAGGVVWWTTFGAALAPVVLLLFGLLLAGSSKKLNDAIYNDPIGALSTILPSWFLVPFLIVALLGLIGGAALDIYSSGLSLLSAGLRIPRYAAAGIDGVIMIAGAIYIVFFAGDFVFTFQGFLITLGVPIAAWAGIFLADLLLRRKDYADAELGEPSGRYGRVRPGAIVLLVVATVLGWGLVTNTYADWLTWQGYLLGLIGGKDGAWAGANLGVLLALLVGFVGTLLVGRGAVRRQEALPLPESR